MAPRSGHGILVLRDLVVDALVLDGVLVPDPKSTDDPRFRGAFRGYFDVPPGTHTIVGRVAGRDHAMSVVVLPGWATVKRFDTTEGWGDDDDDTRRHYRSLALSGSMSEAGALRPWPLCSVFFRGSSDDLRLDGQAIGPSVLPFRGIVDLPPGAHVLEVATKRLELDLAAESATLVDLTGGDAPAIVTGELAASAIATDLLVAPFDALVPARALREPPAARVFGAPDFEWLREAFAGSEGAPADSSAAQRYVNALRWHYVRDDEMGAQAPYFARLGQELAMHVRARRALLHTAAATYLRYFAEDLVDAGQPATIEAGRALAAAIAQASPARSAAPRRARARVVVPLLLMAFGVAVALILTRRPSTSTDGADRSATRVDPSKPRRIDFSSAKKQIAILVWESELAHATALHDEAVLLEETFSPNDCHAASPHFDAVVSKELAGQAPPPVLFARQGVLIHVGGYCAGFTSDGGPRW
jgi:hypothetical protein